MHRILSLATATIVPLALAASAGAADGVLITERTTSPDGKVTTNQVQLDQNHMRAETADREARTVIFDNTAQVLRMVNDETKTYREMTKADVDRMAGQMSDAMARMQDAMKNMPPEQRARIEEMMKGRGMAMGGAPAVKTEYKKVGSDKVGKWACDKYEGTRNGEKVVELCTVDPSALGLTQADFAVAFEMANFFKALVPQGAERMFMVGRADTQGFNGVPVRRVNFSNGQPQDVHELVGVTRQTFPASTWEVPAGYQKQPLMGGRGRGRGL